MKILVCIKAVPEPEHAISDAGTSPEVSVDDSVDLRMSRFDEFAVEEAVLIKEYFPETTVHVITMGPENALKIVKRAIGMGADNGTHILSDYHTSCDAMAASSCIAKVAQKENFDIILCGIMSEDMMQFSVGPMLAQHLSLPWATSVIKTDINSENRKIRVDRELEGGVREIIDIGLPALLTIQSGINEPRYPSLSNMLRANKSLINVISADSLQMAPPNCRTAGYAYPEKKRDGLILEGTPPEKAEKLLRILKEKALI